MAPRTIFIIRHGEKPADPPKRGKAPPPYGIDADGVESGHSLLTRGWQRAGALVTLFAPRNGQLRPGFAIPQELIAPLYTDHPMDKERTHETIQPIADALGLAIEATHDKDDERAVGNELKNGSGITLVCWEHQAIQKIAQTICPQATIPPWDGNRFDVVFAFTSDTGPDGYTFKQIPQLLLAGDSKKLMASQTVADATAAASPTPPAAVT